MKITLIQTSLYWQDREKNLDHFEQKIGSIGESTDLIILPEMFSTGFTMQPERHSEPAEGPSFELMQKMAMRTGAVVTGSVSVKDGINYYNRLYWVQPDGNYQHYDKRHLFRLAEEDKHYAPGKKKLIVKIGDWKVCPLICYDLRFPVWSRNRFRNGEWDYDLLLYVANWPAVRAYSWSQLLIARAIENQCYVAGSNRVGKDGNGYEHSGDSVVLDFKGQPLFKAETGSDITFTSSLDLNALRKFRKEFPAGLDADSFEIQGS